MNEGVRLCSGEIVVFSDVDAAIERGALRSLARRFADPAVGGVCGRMVIRRGDGGLDRPQRQYLRFDTFLKRCESNAGSVSSNTGTLHAIRRSLWAPLPPAVTDDLYTCLSVVSQGFRFLFDQEAEVYIDASSRDSRHELQRRRRIVSGSLRGIWKMRRVLNPLRFGAFAVGLFLNKVLRRLLPLFLAVLLVSSGLLARRNAAAGLLFVLQAVFYAAAACYPLAASWLPRRNRIAKLAALPFYFCLGNYGTLLGVIDFLGGREITKWSNREPGAEGTA
jgi:cellulose synthase/poly-beta-1,6-N-acetylglucosamine synthase-like glycosyltransferase